jgi:hypothetical protein
MLDPGDVDLPTKAAKVRVGRLGREMGLAFLLSMVADASSRPILRSGPAEGWLVLCFAALAIVVYLAFRRLVRRVDPASFAWRRRSPWLLVYVPGVAVLILAAAARRWWLV